MKDSYEFTEEEMEEYLQCEGIIDFPSELRTPKKGIIDDLVKALKEDAGYYYSWQANIAMAFQDAYYWDVAKNKEEVPDIHRISNEAARNFLNLLINESK